VVPETLASCKPRMARAGSWNRVEAGFFRLHAFAG